MVRSSFFIIAPVRGFVKRKKSPAAGTCSGKRFVLSVHAALVDRGPRWPGRIAAARTRMEPPMYRMVVPVMTVED